VLGALDPGAFLGGRRALRGDLAAAAIDAHIAGPLGLDTVRAAAGIVRVVESNVVSAIRAVSLERGIDPRRFTLVAGGGAGPIHATRVARALAITRVLVPREAGTFCAFGMTVTDVRHDHARALHCQTDALDLDAVRAVYAELEEEARGRLAENGFQPDEMTLERSVDARYPGQVHEITVPVPDPRADGFANDVAEAFHHEHRRRFTYDRPDLPVELLHWRLAASGGRAGAALVARAPVGGDAILGTRPVWFEGDGFLDAQVVDADALAADASVDGPAVLQAPTTTILLGPGDRLRAVGAETFVIEIATR
jgi:N-methylhydantoinase A